MAFLRRAGNLLGRVGSNHVSREIFSSRPSIFQAIRSMSSSKLFIGGLSYSTDDRSLQETFSKYGQVAEARVIVDRDSGRSRGFAFVTYSSADEATAAFEALKDQDKSGLCKRGFGYKKLRRWRQGRGRGGGGGGGG